MIDKKSIVHAFSEPAIRISLIYLLVGFSWIIFSDRILTTVAGPSLLEVMWLGTAKGLFFVVTTAALLYFMIRHHQYRLQTLNQELESVIEVRTRDLKLVNEELVTSNEELKAANEELSVLNEQLHMASEKIFEQAKTIVAQKDEQLNRVLNSSKDVIFSIDLTSGDANYVSRSAEAVYGKPIDHLIREPFFWMLNVHPADVALTNQSRATLNKEGTTECTYRLLFPDGRVSWMRNQLTLIRDSRGQDVRLDGIITDITSLKNAESTLRQERQLLRSLIDNLPDYIYVKDTNLRYLISNTANQRLMKAMSEKEILGETEVSYLSDASKLFLEDDLNVIQTKKTIINREEKITVENGCEVTVLTTKVPLLDDEGAVIGLVGLSRDITEFKKQKGLLSQYRENLDIIFSTTVEEILLLDSEGKIVLFNAALERFITEVTGAKPVVGEYVWNTTVDERKEISKQLFYRTLAGESVLVDATVKTTTGELIHELRYNPVWIDDSVKYVTIISVDVTEKRLKERQLAQSQQNLKIIFENTNELFALLDADYNVISFNTAYSEVLRKLYGIELIEGQSIFSIAEASRRETLRQLLERAKSGEEIEYIQNFVIDAVPHWYKVSIKRVLNDQHAIMGYCISSVEVSEIVQARENLRASEEKFRALVEKSDDIFMIINEQMRVTYVSPNIQRILGYTEDEFIGLKAVDLVHPDEYDQTLTDIDHITKSSGDYFTTERRMRHKDGRWVWLSGSTINLLNTPGIWGRISVYHTITELKERTDQIVSLNKSLTDFQNAIFQSSIVSRADKTGRITFVNEKFVAISGYSEAELLGQNHRIINSGHHAKDFWIGMWKKIAKGENWRGEVKNKAKNGSYYWVDTFVMPFLDSEGNVKEFLSIRNDITERINSEEDLKRSEYLLAKSNEVGRIGYFTVDPKTMQGNWSDEVCRIHGLQPGTFDGSMKTFIEFVHPDDRNMVVLAIDNALRKKQGYNIDNRIVLKDGSQKWVHHVAEINYDEAGNPDLVIGVTQDITNRKTSEAILKEYNERFEIVSKATNDAIWDWDIIHDFEVWNHGLETIFGYPETVVHAPSQWWKEKIHPNDYESVLAAISCAFFEKKSLWSASYRYRCADNSYKHVLDRAYIIYRNDTPIRMIGAIQDVTEQKKSIEEIEKLSLVAESTSNAVVITDADVRIEWVNRSFTKLTGYTLNEVEGKRPGSFLQGLATNKETIQRISKALKEHTIVNEEIVNYSKTGEKYWVRLNIAPVFDDRGEIQHFISVQTDITEQKNYEERITTIAQELSNLIENANVPIFGVDRQGRINEWNRTAVDISGYSHQEVWGVKWVELMDPALTPSINQVLESVFDGQSVGNFELPFLSKSGQELIFFITLSPRRDINRNIIGAICVGQDLTELIHYREGLEKIVEDRTRELNEALAKEKELVEMKSRFVSIASHEFRTPLTTISIASGFIKKYREQITAPEIDRKLDTIEKQITHMTHLLDDVLMIGKAEAGKINADIKPIDFSEFLEKLAEEVAISNKKTHLVQIEWIDRLAQFQTDEKLMRNILINLLNNAIKFSPKAKEVHVQVQATKKTLTVKVRDFGIGIPEQDRENLFQAFYRGGNVSAIPGTGLGLSIVRKATQLLGGIIYINSNVAPGTEFVLELPVYSLKYVR